MRSSRLGKNGMMAAVGAMIGLAGCGTPHNDVLVFGTHTKLGIDVSATPDSGATPNFTIGYKRSEAVWMPLYVNAENSKALSAKDRERSLSESAGLRPVAGSNANPTTAMIDEFKYFGSAEGVDSKIGGSKQEMDTYSVFASFGADAGASSRGANMAVAQFFATGIAAQRLGSNPQVTKLVATQQPEEQALEEAKKRADFAQKQVFTAEERLVAVKAAADRVTEDDAKITLILSKVAPGGQLDSQALADAVDKTDLSQFSKDRVKGYPSAEELKKGLQVRDFNAIDPLFKQLFGG